jgi:hypothetical protein
VVAVLDDGDVDVHDVPALEALVTGDAVTDLVVDGGADGSGESPVVQRRGDGLLDPGDVVVADGVELVRGDPGLDMGPDHVEHVRREAPGHAHPIDRLGGLDLYAHRRAGCVHVCCGSLGIA